MRAPSLADRRASAVRRRYTLVAIVKLNALDVGLWQKRRRWFALFSLLPTPPKYDFPDLVKQLCRSEEAWGFRLEQCLVDDENKEELRKYGISEADRDKHRVLSAPQEASLESALGRLKRPLTREAACKQMLFCDTGKSEERAGATIGYAPTLTASNVGRVYCTKLRRFLYPVEHCLLQGWQADQIKARALAARACGPVGPVGRTGARGCVSAGRGEGVSGRRSEAHGRIGRHVAGPAGLPPSTPPSPGDSDTPTHPQTHTHAQSPGRAQV